MGSTQQSQAVVEMVLVGSFKQLERWTHREWKLLETFFISATSRFLGEKVDEGYLRTM